MEGKVSGSLGKGQSLYAQDKDLRIHRLCSGKNGLKSGSIGFVFPAGQVSAAGSKFL